MGFRKKDLLKTALKAIKEKNLFFIEDVVAYLPCSKPTFYAHNLNEVNELKEILEYNKIKTKSNLKAKWYKSDNPTLQLALYKLLANDNERRKLSMQHIDYTSKGEKVSPIDLSKLSDEALRELQKIAKGG